MKKIGIPKLKLSKASLKRMDWSRVNLRKLNGLTIISLLSYFNILVLIPLFFARKSSFAQFHARQGLALLTLTVLFSFSFYFSFLPWLFAVLIVACFIIGVLNVVTGHERPLPIIGKLAK
jgi:uncharacterized membrane protein